MTSRALLFWLLLPACTPAEHALGDPTGAECNPYLRYGSDIAPLLSRYCLTCHASALPLSRRHGAPADHNLDSEEAVRELAEHVELAAAGGPLASNTAMPPSGWPAPTAEEREVLGAWLSCVASQPHGHTH